MSPETYWKRRVFVLAGLLVVVAVVAYACSGPSTSGKEQAANSDASKSPTPTRSSSPSVSPPASPSDGPSASEGADKGGESGGKDGAKDDGSDDKEGSGDSRSEGKQAAPKKPEDPCRPQDVVVTLKTNKKNYAWDAKPKIELTVVNTGEQTCTVDVGPKNMEVRVNSGDDRVYSTADCAKGKATDNRKLERGRPYEWDVSWNRKRSWEGCPDRNVDAKRPGTYVASLHSDYDREAQDQSFRLK